MDEDREDRRRPYFKEQFRRNVYDLQLAAVTYLDTKQKTKDMYIGSKGFVPRLRQYAKDYSLATTIQGVFYMGENRSFCEKIFWATTVFLSLIICSVMIYEASLHFQHKSVIISFDTMDTAVHDIPFPAVTICPETKSMKKFFDFHEYVHMHDDNYTSLPEELFQMYKHILTLCDHPGPVLGVTDTFSDDFYLTLDKVKPAFDELFIRCELFGKGNNCSELFFPILTDQGICYSFNMVSRENLFQKDVFVYRDFYKSRPTKAWNEETGYKKGFTGRPYPNRVFLSGTKNGLQVILRSNRKSYDYSCKSNLEGFKISVHHPLEVPDPFKNYFFVPMNKMTTVAISPRLIRTDKSVRNFKAEKRKCYLEKEKSLDRFKTYSQKNCLLDCFTRHTLSRCECVAFYMPRTRKTPVCGDGKLKCLNEVLKDLFLKDKENDCDCKALCNDLTYLKVISQNTWNWQGFYENLWPGDRADEKKKFNSTEDDLAWLNIYFFTSHFLALKRHELYGVIDLISKFGGFLSLFTGLSFITLMEIIYFLTIRILCNRRLYGSWSGP